MKLNLHWAHWTVLVLSALLTLSAWYITRGQIEEKAENAFHREAERVVDLIVERLAKYEDGLWGGVGAIQSHGGHVGHNEWMVFANALDIDQKYPGIAGIGVIDYVKPDQLGTYLAVNRRVRPDFEVHPVHDNSEYWPITHIEPVATNAKAVGLDIAHENNRWTAGQKARDSGTAQITGPIVLVQDSGKTSGFLFYAPYYRNGPHRTMKARKEHFVGMVYAPFIVKNLMDGVLSKERRHVGVRLQDGDEVMHDEHVAENPDFDPTPQYSQTFRVEMYGRTWDFDIRSDQSFRAAGRANEPTAILMGGIIIDSALLGLFLLLSHRNQQLGEEVLQRTAAEQALLAAHCELEDRVAQRTASLERSNQDLESFAYIASHDLRAPLRAIDALAEMLEEDLVDVLDDESRENMTLLRQRAKRLDGLMDGLLTYSRAGEGDYPVEVVDCRALVIDIVDGLDVPDGFTVRVADDLPSFETVNAPLHHVFTNLLYNAVKHRDRDDTTVVVSAKTLADVVEFSVADDGPGIPEDLHEMAFAMFQTLRPRDEVEGSGIGLAVVKRIVDRYGGSLSLKSDAGEGAVFTIRWPKHLVNAEYEGVV